MATSKQPVFPQPPLEIGVPNYPTPSVPDFYTKSGHIILVVKESTNKGPYNPKPLDGSVTYTGRDANKWPSTLYLVHQAPTADSEYVYNTYANDRTLASQDPWNYGITYSSENPSYPIYTRQYIVPRSEYDSVALGQVDPVFGGTARIVKQEMAELGEDNKLRSRYVVVQRVYESIPGPTLAGLSLQEFGVANLVQGIVAPDSTFTPDENTISAQLDPVDSSKSKLSKLVYDSTQTLNSYQYDEDLGLVVHTTKEIIPQGTSPVDPPDGLIYYKDEPVNAYQTIRIQSKISALPEPRVEYKAQTYANPNLLFSFGGSYNRLPNDGGAIHAYWLPNMVAKRSYITTWRHETTFQYGQPSEPADTLFDPVTVNVYYDGYFIHVNVPDCLTNPDLHPSIELTADPYYGDWYERYIIPATTISADDYLALAGSYQQVSYEVDYWKANIWRVTKQFVLLK